MEISLFTLNFAISRESKQSHGMGNSGFKSFEKLQNIMENIKMQLSQFCKIWSLLVFIFFISLFGRSSLFYFEVAVCLNEVI